GVGGVVLPADVPGHVTNIKDAISMTIDTAQLTFTTSLGDIVIALHEEVAPKTVQYVRSFVGAGLYADAGFYRSTRFGVAGRLPLLQGGPLSAFAAEGAGAFSAEQMLDTVEPTSVTGLADVRGTVSLARDIFETGHVAPEPFICLDNYPELDEGGRTEPDTLGFPASGSVTADLEVVAAIAAMEKGGVDTVGRFVGEFLTEPVAINRAIC
ncbi:MAG: peptidylprolyl isomerase, partial [Nakamurella sp.]